MPSSRWYTRYVGAVSLQQSNAQEITNNSQCYNETGRLMALIQQNRLRISNIKLAVLDEADKLIGDDFKAQTK